MGAVRGTTMPTAGRPSIGGPSRTPATTTLPISACTARKRTADNTVGIIDRASSRDATCSLRPATSADRDGGIRRHTIRSGSSAPRSASTTRLIAAIVTTAAATPTGGNQQQCCRRRIRNTRPATAATAFTSQRTAAIGHTAATTAANDNLKRISLANRIDPLHKPAGATRTTCGR